MSRLFQLGQDFNGTTYDVTFGFGYNPAGQIVSSSRSNDLYSFTGHANGSVSDTVNGLNQVTASGATAIGHDARGNITSIGASAYAYSSENLLTGAPGNWNYCHDGLGRLYSYGWTGTCDGAVWLSDGWNPAAEFQASGTLSRWNVYGPDGEWLAILVPLSGGGLAYAFHHFDERGSFIGASRSNGNFWTPVPVTFDEYGRQGTTQSGLGFTGARYLPGAPLLHLRHRAYSPQLGRFMQTDPIGYDGGMNLYAYVRNDPVNLTDPLGLQEDCLICTGPTPVVTGTRVRTGGRVGSRLPARIQVAAPMTDAGGNAPACHIVQECFPPASPPPSPPPPPPPCGGGTGLRLPDFYQTSAVIPLPMPVFGVGGSLTIDRYGQVYAGVDMTLLGLPTAAAGTVAVGWMAQLTTPTPQQLRGFMTGWSGSGNIGGYYVGGSYMRTQSSGNGVTIGASTPGGSLQRQHGWLIGTIGDNQCLE